MEGLIDNDDEEEEEDFEEAKALGCGVGLARATFNGSSSGLISRIDTSARSSEYDTDRDLHIVLHGLMMKELPGQALQPSLQFIHNTAESDVVKTVSIKFRWKKRREKSFLREFMI